MLRARVVLIRHVQALVSRATAVVSSGVTLFPASDNEVERE